jgi:serine/threonine-protein kinase HipA
MSYKPVISIEVVCWDTPVAVVAFDARAGVYAFEYYESYRADGWELSPIMLPLRMSGPVPAPKLSQETYYGLHPLVADSLPDAFGNLLIDGWMAANGVHHTAITPLDRLAYMGKRGMGALEFRPALRSEGLMPSAIELGGLVKTARKALRVDLHDDSLNPVFQMSAFDDPAVPGSPQTPGIPLAPGSPSSPNGQDIVKGNHSTELAQLIAVGTSAGGARAKAVVGYSAGSDSFVSGQFDLPDGFEHWLIKFDIESPVSPGSSRPYGRIEYAYSLMARASGINIQPCRLYSAAGRAHFMTKRFDRKAQNTKLHMQTLCALVGLDYNQRDTHDYNQLFMAIDDLGLGYEASDEAFRRMAFNVAMANNDDHSKNHSFLLSQQDGWSLAPAYDLTHAYNPKGLWTSRHLMSVNGRFQGITRKDLLAVASRFKIAAPGDIIDLVLEVASKWPGYAEEAGIEQAEVERIAADITECSTPLRH